MSPSGVLRQHVQDPAATGSGADRSLLPRQLGETLEDVLEQYRLFFDGDMGFPITDGNVELTDQDIEDLLAFMKLL